MQIKTTNGGKRRAAAIEVSTEPGITAILAANAGQVGTFFDNLTAGQKSALLKSLVVNAYNQEQRIAYLENVVFAMAKRLAALEDKR